MNTDTLCDWIIGLFPTRLAVMAYSVFYRLWAERLQSRTHLYITQNMTSNNNVLNFTHLTYDTFVFFEKKLYFLSQYCIIFMKFRLSLKFCNNLFICIQQIVFILFIWDVYFCKFLFFAF